MGARATEDLGTSGTTRTTCTGASPPQIDILKYLYRDRESGNVKMLLLRQLSARLPLVASAAAAAGATVMLVGWYCDYVVGWTDLSTAANTGGR